MGVGSSRRIPHFIAAATLRELQRRMLIVNMSHGMEFRWFDIQFDPLDKVWVAFYYNEIKSNKEIIEVVGGGE